MTTYLLQLLKAKSERVSFSTADQCSNKLDSVRSRTIGLHGVVL